MKINKNSRYLLSVLLACILAMSPVLANDLRGDAVDKSDEAQEPLSEDEVWQDDGTEVVWADPEPEEVITLSGSQEPEEMEIPETSQAPESQAEEVMLTLGGNIRMPDTLSAEDVLVLLYDLEVYEKDDPDSAIRREFSDKKGDYEFEDLQPGGYRLEFFALEEEFDPDLYEVLPAAEKADYQVVQQDGKDYFAFVLFDLDENWNEHLLLEVQEKKAEEDYIVEETKEETADEPEKLQDEETEIEESEKKDDAEETAEQTEEETKDESQSDEIDEMVETGETVPDQTAEPESDRYPEWIWEPDADAPVTAEDLLGLDMDEVGAIVEEDISSGFFTDLQRLISGETWSFDIYYVGENNRYHTDKTMDFSLKYQMEFHTSETLDREQVEIRIPAALLRYREGAAIRPAQIAVPLGSPEAPVGSRSTPFNYYLDEEKDELVFFNYQTITAGSNAAFQVLYSNLKIMEIEDETEWKLQSVITVERNGKKETKESDYLTGTVDSEVTLTRVTKTPYNYSGTNYTPGLYTQNQVEKYVDGPLPQEFIDHFNDYNYVVWRVAVSGNATQPWNMRIEDTTEFSGGTGKIVGYGKDPKDNKSLPLNQTILTDGEYAGYIKGIEYSKQTSIEQTFYVVTAYLKSEVEAGELLTNNVNVVLEPYDKKDDDQSKSDFAQWSYKDYVWRYYGDTIGIRKTANTLVTNSDDSKSTVNYAGWLEVYKQARNNQEDKGDFSYTAKSETYGYGFTHITEPQAGVLGERIPGASYTVTTVDDVLYAHSSLSANNPIMMDDKDYYFSSIEITQKDVGYDIWEETTAEPEDAGSLIVSAMFEGSTEWEEITEIPWKSSGIISYSFTSDDLARKPWRVKAVHNSVNYLTTCTIKTKVRIRWNSPVFLDLLQTEPDSVTVQNIAGTMGQLIQDDEPKGWFHDDGEYNYNAYPDNLKNVTRGLYSVLIMRDSAQISASGLLAKAASYKTAKATNDPQNGRVRVNYALTAYDGYKIYGQDGINYLTSSGKKSPGRKEVIFYDLLPYGVRFDPSVEVIAGRTITIDPDDAYQHMPVYWDRSQVKVVVDSEEDIILNYENTGRTMVRFHIFYEGAESSFFSKELEMWMEGWGISFGAYYEWKDSDIVCKIPNISAFMPARDDNDPLIGSDGEVFFDDGKLPPGLEDVYKDFGPDIDKDGIENEWNVLYAHATVNENIAIASTSEIEKLVRADADRFGSFGTSAVVENGKGYTYEITISSAKGILEDIVVFDRLENAAKDRIGYESTVFDDDWWHGEFAGIQTRALTEKGIAPIVYYSNRRENALITEQTESPTEVLKPEYGWYTEAQWAAEGYTLSDVRAFAVDISKTLDGKKFQLPNMESVSFQVQMLAPMATDYVHAYNNPSFYSYETETDTAETVAGDSVKVRIGLGKTIEIVKQFEGEIPSIMTDNRFEFTAYKEVGNEEKGWANQEYFLYAIDSEGEWQPVAGLYATDSDGRFYLRAGEKAVFDQVPGAEEVLVRESENPYWEQTSIWYDDGEVKQLVVTNEYRSVVYAQKKVQYTPGHVNSLEEEFIFQLLIDGEPLANAPFWYVSSVRTDGGIPNKVISKGDNGTGITDENGMFKIKPGELIMLFAGKAGARYTLKEVSGAGSGDDWFTNADEVTGTIPILGIHATITNYYRWKDLYLTKTVTNQDLEDCKQVFTFRITDKEGNPLVGNRWTVMRDGVDTGDTGILNGQGEFKAACAGAVVRISGLEAGKTYIIEETDSGQLYQAVNDGIVEVTMPLYGTNEKAEIVNDYLMRPISVSKIVLYDEKDPVVSAEVKNRPFTMTILVNGVVLADWPYDLYENGVVINNSLKTNGQGQFTLKNGQTAVFEEVGMKGASFVVTETPDDTYEQRFPIEGGFEGNLDSDDTKVTFINAHKGSDSDDWLMLRKEYVGADEAGKEAVEVFQNDPTWRAEAAVTLTLEIIPASGDPYIFPKEDQWVTISDDLGSAQQVMWFAGDSIELEPWKTICLVGMEPDMKYRLYESSEDQHRLLEWNNGNWLEISQKTPEYDREVSGNVEENPYAVIVNEAKQVEAKGSVIHKAMEGQSEDVATGSRLVWRLEEYDGTVWNPKSGIFYWTFDDDGPTCDRSLETGSDGLIVLTKTEYGYPQVRFLEADVKLNYTDEMSAGDLRLVEVLEESDSEWGYLSGYLNGDGESGLDMKPGDAIGFLNSNRMVGIEIEKKMQQADGTSFAMILEQVIKAAMIPITSKDEILATEIRGGMRYTIHDSETDELLGEGISTSKGEIMVKAGQYVKIQVPGETLWTVSEQVKLPYRLISATGNPPDRVTSLGDNLMLIQALNPPPEELQEILLTSEMVSGGVVDAVTGTSVNLNTGNVVIPEQVIVDGKKCIIVGIESRAFDGCSTLTQITIPDTVTRIGSYAFNMCSSLEAVALPDNLVTVSERAFYSCTSLKKVMIPANIATMGSYVFADCSNLTDVIFAEGATKMGTYTFLRCEKLVNVTLPASITEIGNNVFQYCSSLVEIDLSDNITRIGNYSFSYCSGLQDIILPDNLRELGNCAFWESESLREITIPASVEAFGSYVFRYCTGLVDVTLSDGLTSIGIGAFSDCSSLPGITFPASITAIKANSFAGCTNLSNIILPNNLAVLGDSAFSGCDSLSEITVPGSVTHIGNGAFNNCKNLTKATILPGVQSLGRSVFRECRNLTDVSLPVSISEMDESIFEYCKSLEKIVLPYGIDTIPLMTFSRCDSLKEVVVPATVKTIGAYAFRYCTSLEEISLPQGLITIESDAFAGSNLLYIEIPSTVTTIDSTAFNECYFLYHIYIYRAPGTIPGSPWGAPFYPDIQWRGTN